MLKREITFEDFNGEKQTEVHYFNLSKSELIELESSFNGGLERNLQAIIEAKDSATLLKEFKTIILMAYGQKSPDGKRFIKNDQLREEFKQTAAYDALFMELATDDKAGAAFIRGVIPADLAEEVRKEQESGSLQQATAEKLGTAPKTTAEIAAEQA